MAHNNYVRPCQASVRTLREGQYDDNMHVSASSHMHITTYGCLPTCKGTKETDTDRESVAMCM